MLNYTITPHPLKKQWHISLFFQQNQSQEIKLANWTPGSYMIRDFSRHLIRLEAFCDNQIVELTQTAKNIWQTPHVSGNFRIDYVVYANDMSMRASYLDGNRGFFDGACLFLSLPQLHHQRHIVHFEKLPENWQISTALSYNEEQQCFQAASYAELIDCPVEMGKDLEYLDFIAGNIPHRITLSGVYPDFDRERLRQDTQRICETALSMFPSPAPFKNYLFLLHLGDNIYGGLEHVSSTALHSDRHSLPSHHMQEADEAYTQLLGLISHEYFHAWNVKSIKPESFQPYDLDQECYTEQLWAFEGITSYYDDLILLRSGVISQQNYLQLLAKLITRVWRTAGRKQQTLAQSSFSAWHKYYKQDENSPNAITSYYQQGALMALCLDLILRSKSQNTHSLDTIMHSLYQHWLNTQQGLPEKAWQQYAQETTQLDLQDFFHQALYTTSDLPLIQCLQSVGIELRFLPKIAAILEN